MRLSLRFIIPLVLVLAFIGAGLVPLTEKIALRWFIRDLNVRSNLVASSIETSLATSPRKADLVQPQIVTLFNRMATDQNLDALALCARDGTLLLQTGNLPRGLSCANLDRALKSSIFEEKRGSRYVAIRPILNGRRRAAELVLVHDMLALEKRTAETSQYILYIFSVIAVVISFIAVSVAQLSWRWWINGMRTMFKTKGFMKLMPLPELRPIAKEFRKLVKDIEASRRVRDESQVSWSPPALKNILQRELAGEEVIIVSNREPYVHNRNQATGKIEVQRPASGLVTALEPVMRACSGTWVAHGSGNADREVVDDSDRVRVPPEDPSYFIRRVWLNKEEEDGYYYGFANEGLWPLCHIAHTRPIFRSADWNQYVKVNEKFAQAVVEEAKTSNPVILVQDYHFALLPRMIKDRLPNATIITFWHIPWPNPEAFGICPWRDEILHGLLGSSILGFHTRFHCNNFLETVDRYIEARIDRETSTITHDNQISSIQHYPISIEWPARWVNPAQRVADCRTNVRTINNLPERRLIGVGVDRLDYTKGIVERFLAVERLFELKPEWIGRFTFVQIAAPSRSVLEEYRRLDKQVRDLAERINQKYGTHDYQPICLKVEHHEPEEVFSYFRASDVCIVSSLHDGMNLVAKEFIASRDDERGVLILSQFTGAARELPEALIINPYDIDQFAAALHVALSMSPVEQGERMNSMRASVQEFNVYRWAGKMLTDAARIRQKNKFKTHWTDLAT